MKHLNTLNSLRTSLTVALALAGVSVASASEWQPRAAVAGYSIETTVINTNWVPRSSVRAAQSGLVHITQAGWAPRSALGGSAPVEVAVTTDEWTPRSTIANPQTDKPALVAGWVPRTSLDIDPAMTGTNIRGHRNTAGTVIASRDPVSTSAIAN